MAESQGVAYSNGKYMPVSEAAIPLLDPAFTKSDVVFDALSVWDGNFFRLDDHLARFRASCEYVRMHPPHSEDEIKQILARCVDEAGLSRAVVYFICTRGRYAGGRVYGHPSTCRNEFHAFAVPYYAIVPEDRVKSGVHLWVVETRRAPNVAINQRVKSFNRMDLTRGQFEALDNGADQPLLLSTEGYLTEGPGFNVWIVKGDRVRTPGDNVLEGITRLTVFELCREIALTAEAADLTPEDLYGADEAFLSSSGGGVIPAVMANNRAIGSGRPGELTRRLSDLYWEKRAQGWHATPVADLLAKAAVEMAAVD